MGMGVDVHGHDYTKAARRAVSDALRHSSLNFFDAAGKTRDDMYVEVIVAVAEPEAVDTEAVPPRCPTAASPFGPSAAVWMCRHPAARMAS